jgi:GT2 family glycosyltransferase
VIAFLDADCLASRTWLTKLAERYQDPDVCVVGGGVTFPEDNYWTVCDNLSWFHEVLASSPAGRRTYLPTLNFSLRREVVDRVGGLDERFPQPAGEDTEWTLRMHLAGYTLHFEPRATVYHCHPRDTLRQVLVHAFYFGRHSVRVDPRYAEAVHSPRFMRHPLLLLLLAPALAGGATARILVRAPQYGHTLPVLYLTKLSWCLGAALGRRSSRASHREGSRECS